MKVHNVHERRIAAPVDAVGPLLDTIAGPEDAVWPGDRWPPMRLDRPLSVGATGGHGDIRYTVDEYVPGRRAAFRFADDMGVIGTHWIDVVPDGSATVVRHVIEGRLTGAMRLVWPLVIRPLHDAVLEDLLDNVERGATGAVRRPATWSPRVRLTRWAFSRLRRRRPQPAVSAA